MLHTDKLGLDRERREIPDDGVKLDADLRRIGDVGDHKASEASENFDGLGDVSAGGDCEAKDDGQQVSRT